MTIAKANHQSDANHSSSSASGKARFVLRVVSSVLVLMILAVAVHLWSVVALLLKPTVLPSPVLSDEPAVTQARWVPVESLNSDDALLPLADSELLHQSAIPQLDTKPLAAPESSKGPSGLPFSAFSILVMERMAADGKVDAWLLQTELTNEQLLESLSASGLQCSEAGKGKSELHVRTENGSRYILIPGPRSSGQSVITVLRVGVS